MDVRMDFSGESARERLLRAPIGEDLILELKCGLLLHGRLAERDGDVCWIDANGASNRVRASDLQDLLPVVC